MRNSSIVIVENRDIGDDLRHAFEDHGYYAWTCPAPAVAVSIFAAVQPEVVLLDLDFEGTDALGLLQTWKEVVPEILVIVETSQAEDERLHAAMDHGADGFVLKPFAIEPLFEMLGKSRPVSPAAA